MKDKPLVSIVINNYNYGRFLRTAIESALKQSYSHTEIIVVDDGSTDSSRQIINDYKSCITAIFKSNGGLPSALNAGFFASLGDIICFLDSDDSFEQNKVEEIVNVFKSYPDMGWCFHPLRLVDTNTRELLGTTIAFPKLGHNISSHCDLRTQIKGGKLPFYAPSTSALSFKRSLLEQIMPLAEEFRFCEDRYVSHLAIALSPGYFLNQELTLQGIHDNNVSTLRKGKEKQQISAQIAISTAYCMRIKCPDLVKFTNRMFARGLSHSWKAGTIEARYSEIVRNYFSMVSLLEKLEIGLIAIYQSRPWKEVKLYKAPT